MKWKPLIVACLVCLGLIYAISEISESQSAVPNDAALITPSVPPEEPPIVETTSSRWQRVVPANPQVIYNPYVEDRR